MGTRKVTVLLRFPNGGFTMSHATLAYLDAGTGSIILQAILGGTAAVAVGLKLWWRKILHALHIRRQPDEGPRPDAGTAGG
jgi:hypothetical protein